MKMKAKVDVIWLTRLDKIKNECLGESLGATDLTKKIKEN